MSVSCRKLRARTCGVALLLTLFFLQLSACSASVSGGEASLSADAVNSKLDPGLARELNFSDERMPTRMLDVLIKTAGTIGQSERSALEKEGCTIGSVAGNIVSAKVPADRIPGLARLPFVVYIEKVKKLKIRSNP